MCLCQLFELIGKQRDNSALQGESVGYGNTGQHTDYAWSDEVIGSQTGRGIESLGGHNSKKKPHRRHAVKVKL